jgi:hypothetical protein
MDRHIVDGMAAAFCQVGLMGFPDMPNAKSFVYSFMYSDSQEYFTSP